MMMVIRARKPGSGVFGRGMFAGDRIGMHRTRAHSAVICPNCAVTRQARAVRTCRRAATAHSANRAGAASTDVSAAAGAASTHVSAATAVATRVAGGSIR